MAQANNVFLRYLIEPGYARVQLARLKNGMREITFGCSSEKLEVGSETDSEMEKALFSMIIADPKSARVYARAFTTMADMMEDEAARTKEE